jgi:tetratricopeptide (TPR) repeat protein
VSAGAVLALLLAAAGALPQDTHIGAALERLYGGQTDTAITELRALAAGHPQDPLLPYFEALALEWKLEQRPESTLLDKDVVARAERAQEMAANILKTRPKDERALFAHAAGHAALARYHLFRLHKAEAARASVRMRTALLAVDPAGPYGEDARFGLGLYDYYGDVLPRAVKVLRFVMGLPSGDRARGLLGIERAAERSRFHRVEALVQLYEIHAYWEDAPDRALPPARKLEEDYPSSPLWGLKLAEHLRDRLGQYAEAAAVAREGLARNRRGEINYKAPIVTALLRLSLGEALLRDGRTADARRALLPVLEMPVTADWTARAHLLIGRTQELEGDRVAAVAHYRTAARSPDREIRRRAEKLLEKPVTATEIRGLHLVWEARRLHEAGKVDEAGERYVEARRVWPDGAEPFLGSVDLALRRGQDVVDSRSRLEDVAGDKATEPPWVRAWARLLLGRLHDLDGRRREAQKAYALVEDAPFASPWLLAEARAGQARPFVRRPAPHESPTARKP